MSANSASVSPSSRCFAEVVSGVLKESQIRASGGPARCTADFSDPLRARLWAPWRVVFAVMGRPSPNRLPRALGRRAPLLSAALLAAAVTAGAGVAGAGVLTPEAPKAELATTGDNGELLQGVPISKTPGSRERVVYSLGPDQLEDLTVGERLQVSGEVQISTTCLAEGPKCFGRRYDFNPTISTRIVLADGPTESAASFALSGTTKKLCKQQRPNRNHHCTLVVPNVETTISDLAALPCVPSACYVNLILGASSKKAKRGNKVVVGADQPDGSVKQDKGRLNVVQSAQGVAGPAQSFSNELVNTSAPASANDKEKKRVVYSVPIFAPRKGEILAFDASFVTSISALHFNTFVAARVIVADTPASAETEKNGIARKAALGKGAASESNGFNCTLGSSGYANPCTVVKAGATRIIRDAVDPAGQPATLYLNVVVSGKPLNTEDSGTAPEIALAQGTGLTVQRFTPPLGSVKPGN